MPGAQSVPASSLSKDGKLLPPEELKKRVRGSGHRSEQTGGDLLRLGRDRSRHHAGAGDARPFGQPALRRLVDRMGRAARYAGRDRTMSIKEQIRQRCGAAGADCRHGDIPRNAQAAWALSARRRTNGQHRAAEDAQHAAAFLSLPDRSRRPQMALGQRPAAERRGTGGEDPQAGSRHPGALSSTALPPASSTSSRSCPARPRSPISA